MLQEKRLQKGNEHPAARRATGGRTANSKRRVTSRSTPGRQTCSCTGCLVIETASRRTISCWRVPISPMRPSHNSLHTSNYSANRGNTPAVRERGGNGLDVAGGREHIARRRWASRGSCRWPAAGCRREFFGRHLPMRSGGGGGTGRSRNAADAPSGDDAAGRRWHA